MVEGVPVRGVGCTDPCWGNVMVILEATTYCWTVKADGYRVFFQFGGGADAGEKEYFGGIEGAGREEYLCVSKVFDPFQGLDSDSLEWVIDRKQYTGDIGVG